MTRALEMIFSKSIMHNALKQFGDISLEMLLLFSIIGIAIVLLVTLLLWAGKRKIMATDVMTGGVLAVYASIVIQLTLISRESGSRIGIDMNLFHGLFGGDSYYHWLMWAYMILNVFMFIPFGFLVSMFSVVHDKKIKTQFLTVTLLSFMVSMVIEITQLITRRGIYEVQDLASNTLGGALGWLLFTMVLWGGRMLVGKRREEEAC